MEKIPVLAEDEKEVNVESEAVMESFREERAGILKGVMNRKVLETGLLLAPGIDVAVLAASAARGKTFSGKELDRKSRVNHAAMAGFLALSYTLLAASNNDMALFAKGMALTYSAKEFGPDAIDLIKKTVNLAKEKIPAMASFVEATGEYLLHG